MFSEKEFEVKLVAMTHGVAELGHLSAEEYIVYCARVSNPVSQEKHDTSPKLIRYLIQNKHWSPFEMADLAIEIKTSRGIAPQILRHWSFAFQEFSQRYAKAGKCVIYEARRQDEKNRQNSLDDLSSEIKAWFEIEQKKNWNESYTRYEQALDKGIAKECARFLLPAGTETTMYMKGDIRSWIHYLLIRTEPGVQKEHRDIASAIKQLFVKELPNISEALEWKN